MIVSGLGIMCFIKVAWEVSLKWQSPNKKLNIKGKTTQLLESHQVARSSAGVRSKSMKLCQLALGHIQHYL